ncbi:MAG: hypothetical protein M1828_005499 [Chrysothrix sp. TS-e1954]|nr:MAG: hypothetical protein M1828_005499 [Chrysothrix sp. TS-e1954]
MRFSSSPSFFEIFVHVSANEVELTERNVETIGDSTKCSVAVVTGQTITFDVEIRGRWGLICLDFIIDGVFRRSKTYTNDGQMRSEKDQIRHVWCRPRAYCWSAMVVKDYGKPSAVPNRSAMELGSLMIQVSSDHTAGHRIRKGQSFEDDLQRWGAPLYAIHDITNCMRIESKYPMAAKDEMDAKASMQRRPGSQPTHTFIYEYRDTLVRPSGSSLVRGTPRAFRTTASTAVRVGQHPPVAHWRRSNMAEGMRGETLMDPEHHERPLNECATVTQQQLDDHEKRLYTCEMHLIRLTEGECHPGQVIRAAQHERCTARAINAEPASVGTTVVGRQAAVFAPDMPKDEYVHHAQTAFPFRPGKEVSRRLPEDVDFVLEEKMKEVSYLREVIAAKEAELEEQHLGAKKRRQAANAFLSEVEDEMEHADRAPKRQRVESIVKSAQDANEEGEVRE